MDEYTRQPLLVPLELVGFTVIFNPCRMFDFWHSFHLPAALLAVVSDGRPAFGYGPFENWWCLGDESVLDYASSAERRGGNDVGGHWLAFRISGFVEDAYSSKPISGRAYERDDSDKVEEFVGEDG